MVVNGMTQKAKVSAKKVAAAAGVSPSTVSIVINNKGEQFRISAKTRERVMKTASELGYQHVAKIRRKKRDFSQKIICAFCPEEFDRGPTIQVCHGIQKYLQEHKLGYELIVFPFAIGRLRERAAFISRDFIAGAVMLALGEEDSEFLESSVFDIPMVLYNRTANGYCSVLTDDYAVGCKAASHFVKRGHRKLAIAAPDYSSRALSLRMVGFLNKFKSYNFKPDEALALPTAFGDDSDAGGYAAMQEILGLPVLPTAIFVPSDNMISGVIRSIHDRGLSVPCDFEIISYGNKNINCIVEPNITSFAAPLDDMSYHCARILCHSITNRAATENTTLNFEAELIFRESCPAN
jgi:DNA-binding LacI/PurR family transcriptional regulator